MTVSPTASLASGHVGNGRLLTPDALDPLGDAVQRDLGVQVVPGLQRPKQLKTAQNSSKQLKTAQNSSK